MGMANLFEQQSPAEARKEGEVNHPAHYHQGPYEVIKVITAWSLNFNLGNVVKYVARADHKGNKLQDLKKAAEYIRFEIERIEGKK